MVTGIREFLASRAGQVVTGGLILVAMIATLLSIRSNFGESDVAIASRQRTFVCSETGKSFELAISEDMTFPVKSPFSGHETGFPADEMCSWTEDGQVSDSPTYLLMNRTTGKSGPTFCPTCHRLVVRNNPPAAADRQPPPTQTEYARRRGAQQEDAGASLSAVR